MVEAAKDNYGLELGMTITILNKRGRGKQVGCCEASARASGTYVHLTRRPGLALF